MSKKEKQFSTLRLDPVEVTFDVVERMKKYQINLVETMTDNIMKFDNHIQKQHFQILLLEEINRVTRWLKDYREDKLFNPFQKKVA